MQTAADSYDLLLLSIIRIVQLICLFVNGIHICSAISFCNHLAMILADIINFFDIIGHLG